MNIAQTFHYAPRLISLFHSLTHGPVRIFPRYPSETWDFDKLIVLGFATCITFETGGKPSFTYALSEKGQKLAQDDIDARIPMAQMLAAKGLTDADAKKAGTFYRALQARQRRIDRFKHFPLAKEVKSVAGALPCNEEGGFSSRTLTDWYVQRYCALNSLLP